MTNAEAVAVLRQLAPKVSSLVVDLDGEIAEALALAIDALGKSTEPPKWLCRRCGAAGQARADLAQACSCPPDELDRPPPHEV